MYPCICIRTTIHSDVKAEHIKHTFYIFNCSSVFELELYVYIFSAHFHLARHLAVSASFLFALYSQLDSRARKMLYLVHRTYTHFLSFFNFIPLAVAAAAAAAASSSCCCLDLPFFVRETVHHCLCTRSTVDIIHTHNDKLKVREKERERDRDTERVQVRVCAKKRENN